MESLKLMAIFPHPDDETLGMGPTLAKYSAEGVQTHLLCATRGERGWNGPAEEYPGLAGLGRIREGELRCAAKKLGLSEVTFLNYIDGDVDQADPGEIIAKIVLPLRRVRPQVVVTFGPDGAYGHPDHIALAQFTAAALVCAADAEYKDPAGQLPHRVAKFYYMVDSKSLVQAFNETMGGISMEIDGVVRRHFGWDDWAITTRVDTRAHLSLAWEAIFCHQSQLPGFGPLEDMPEDMRLLFFGVGNFIRVYSLVNAGRKVENDLFAGLRP